MYFIDNLSYAFSIAATPANILLCFFGVLFGTLTGVLPGLGASTAMSLLLPITFNLTPAKSIILLSGIYYGALYGGSTTSILVNVPGEGTSMVTCLDGYPMAKKGRAGPALAVSAIGSFIAGTFSIIMLMISGVLLVKVAIKFGPPEFFAITFFGLTLVTLLATGSTIKAVMMAAFGVLLGCVGLDKVGGVERFTFGIIRLRDGIGLIPILMGLFGIAEVLINIEKASKKIEIFKTKMKDLIPTKKDLKSSAGAITRGTILGFLIGLIPGPGAFIASFASYAAEKKVSKHPEKFGTGVIEGVAGPETANNAAGGASFIPLLTLGIPCNVAVAVLLGALMIHGISPGPMLIEEHPDVFWGVVGSMYIGNVMLVVLNLPLIPIWVKILRIPYGILFPIILLICLIGSYSLNNNMWDVYFAAIFGVLGYLMRKFHYEAAPLVMALVLSPILEVSLFQSLILSNGNPIIFFSRPISATLMILALSVLFLPLTLKPIRRLKGGDE